jgi:hypothetical protein
MFHLVQNRQRRQTKTRPALPAAEYLQYNLLFKSRPLEAVHSYSNANFVPRGVGGGNLCT